MRTDRRCAYNRHYTSRADTGFRQRGALRRTNLEPETDDAARRRNTLRLRSADERARLEMMQHQRRPRQLSGQWRLWPFSEMVRCAQQRWPRAPSVATVARARARTWQSLATACAPQLQLTC